LLSLAEPAARAMLARRLSQLPAHTGTRLNERVRAPIFNTGAREIWVNGKPLEGIAILDTGAMPLSIIGEIWSARTYKHRAYIIWTFLCRQVPLVSRNTCRAHFPHISIRYEVPSGNLCCRAALHHVYVRHI
jgi:hypothetical protein